MYLFDTNVLSELRRPARADANVSAWAGGVPDSAVHISVVSIYEIERGARLIERRDAAQGGMLLRWLEQSVIVPHASRILPVDEAVARAAARLHVPDHRPLADAFIAATALVHGLTLATRNVGDFEGISVALLNPWATMR